LEGFLYHSSLPSPTFYARLRLVGPLSERPFFP
jgi:hypothetical protein